MKAIAIRCLNPGCEHSSITEYPLFFFNRPMQYCSYCGEDFRIPLNRLKQLDLDLQVYGAYERKVSNRTAFTMMIALFLIVLNAILHPKIAPMYALVGFASFFCLTPIYLLIIYRFYLKPRQSSLDKIYNDRFKLSF